MGFIKRNLLSAFALFAVAVFVWAIWAAYNAKKAVDEAREAQSIIEEVDSFRLEDLLAGDAIEPLDASATLLESAHERLSRPLMRPAHWLPVLGRQIKAADDLSSGISGVLRVASSSVRDIRSGFDEDSSVLARMRLVSENVGLVEDAIQAADLGDGNALISVLAETRAEVVDRFDRLRATASRVRASTSAVAELLDGPENHLLLIANNAEMRAGSGMILTTGVLRTQGGAVVVTDLGSSFYRNLEPGAVELTKTYEDHFGFAEVETEWRNLGLTPRFPETAESALRMWQAATGEALDGVILVDPFMLEALLAGMGPVTVDGLDYTEDNILEYLLHGQYLTIDVEQTNTERRQAERSLAPAILSAALTRDHDLDEFVPKVARALAGRHLLLWSPDADRQAAWAEAQLDGELVPNSLSLAFSNRSPSKLDYFIEVRTGMKASVEGDVRSVEVEIAIDNVVDPSEEPLYITGPQPTDETPVELGEYVVLVTANTPGAAVDSRFDGVDDLEVAGGDGPTRIVATSTSVMPGERQTVVLRFELPVEVTELRLEPSARYWPIAWRLGDTDHRVDEPFVVDLESLPPID